MSGAYGTSRCDVGQYRVNTEQHGTAWYHAVLASLDGRPSVDKLIIDRIVQAVLGPSAVSQLFDMREHTELGCPWCGGSIPPEDPVPTTVVVGTTEDRKFLVNFAHESCMPSQIYDLDTNLAFEEPPPVSFTAYPILRYPPASPRAVILFELAGTFFDAGSGEDLNKLSFLRRGWEPLTDSFDRITAAHLPGLSVRRRADTIAVDDDEENVELIAFSNSVVPAIWWDVAAEEGASLIVYGSGLGLERFRWSRVHDALQASTCVAAAAQLESWAELEAVESAEEATSLDQSHADVSSLSAGAHILADVDDLGREDELYVTVYDSHRRRCSAWFRLTGPGRGELEATIERVATSGAPPYAVAAGLEALANGEREQAERVVRDSLEL
jgi:hypothetical protein